MELFLSSRVLQFPSPSVHIPQFCPIVLAFSDKFIDLRDELYIRLLWFALSFIFLCTIRTPVWLNRTLSVCLDPNSGSRHAVLPSIDPDSLVIFPVTILQSLHPSTFACDPCCLLGLKGNHGGADFDERVQGSFKREMGPYRGMSCYRGWIHCITNSS